MAHLIYASYTSKKDVRQAHIISLLKMLGFDDQDGSNNPLSSWMVLPDMAGATARVT
jgi:hypothetical protein